jgi:hypothetical protein
VNLKLKRCQDARVGPHRLKAPSPREPTTATAQSCEAAYSTAMGPARPATSARSTVATALAPPLRACSAKRASVSP